MKLFHITPNGVGPMQVGPGPRGPGFSAQGLFIPCAGAIGAALSTPPARRLDLECAQFGTAGELVELHPGRVDELRRGVAVTAALLCLDVGAVSLEAATFEEALVGGAVDRQYRSIDTSVGVLVLERAPWLLLLQPGASFRVIGEAVTRVTWTGSALRIHRVSVAPAAEEPVAQAAE